jgi:hypothetical protein
MKPLANGPPKQKTSQVFVSPFRRSITPFGAFECEFRAETTLCACMHSGGESGPNNYHFRHHLPRSYLVPGMSNLKREFILPEPRVSRPDGPPQVSRQKWHATSYNSCAVSKG